MNKFSDFSDEKIFDGDKIKINDIINNEIIIIEYKIGSSKYKDKDYLTLQIKYNDEKFVIFTGSNVLIDQIKKYENKIPFITTIRKINKYYSFT